MTIAHQILSVAAILATGVIYGTDVFCTVVQRPALALLPAGTVGKIMGLVHLYGDRRLRWPGSLALVTTLFSVGVAIAAASWPVIAASVVTLAALLGWFALYLRVSAPANKAMTAAVVAGASLPDARALQTRWDSVILFRAVLQGIAVASLLVALCWE